MIYEWKYEGERDILLRTFIRDQGISKRLLAKVKFGGGRILLNGEERTVRATVKGGDVVLVHVPDEGEHETTVPVSIPIHILYEDEHFLAVDKPAGVASVPSAQHPRLSMANRVKGYYKRQQYPDQVIHIVNRLDRDTTGVMLLAKSQYAHSLMDRVLREGQVDKVYYALLSKHSPSLHPHGLIDAPIGRSEDSIITRRVVPEGKKALTEYWLEQDYRGCPLVRIKLHTGRTHQIRVHFRHLGAPLLGDSLYGGRDDVLMPRQALHCRALTFRHPFTEEELTIEAPFPEDFQHWMEKTKGGENDDGTAV